MSVRENVIKETELELATLDVNIQEKYKELYKKLLEGDKKAAQLLFDMSLRYDLIEAALYLYRDTSLDIKLPVRYLQENNNLKEEDLYMIKELNFGSLYVNNNSNSLCFRYFNYLRRFSTWDPKVWGYHMNPKYAHKIDSWLEQMVN